MVLEMVNMDWGGTIGKKYVQVPMHGINGMGLNVWFWSSVMYYKIEWSGGCKWGATNARHSIILPLGRHPSMVIVHLVLLWLSFEIQARKELLDQLALFKDIDYRYGSFHPSMNLLCVWNEI
jgi:hypothetical protein